MTNGATTAYPFLRLEALGQKAPIAAAQEALACWSRAWTQVAHGLMTAGIAQVDLARSTYAVAPIDWANVISSGGMREGSRERLHTAQARFETAVKGYRHINDEFLATLFGAAESLIDVLPPVTQDSTAAPSVVSKASGLPETSPVVPATKQKTAV